MVFAELSKMLAAYPSTSSSSETMGSVPMYDSSDASELAKVEPLLR